MYSVAHFFELFSCMMVDVAGLEGLESRYVVAIAVEADLVEIVLSSHHRKILGPIVLEALVDDGTVGVDALDAIRTRAERRLECRLAQVADLAGGISASPVFPGYDGELRHKQRQIAVAGAGEGERHLAVAGFLSLDDVLVGNRTDGIGFFLLLEGEDHILRQ